MSVVKTPADRELDELAARVRELWIAEHQTFILRVTGKRGTYRPSPRHDGGVDCHGRKHQSVWKKIARLCLDHGLDYARLVRAVFAFHKFQTPPSPDLAHNTTGRQRYYRSLEESPRDVLRELRIQLAELERALGMARALYGETPEAVHYVLANGSLALSSLFRYCLAQREGLADLADMWRDEARRQYFSCKAEYDAAWGDAIPAALLEDTAHGK